MSLSRSCELSASWTGPTERLKLSRNLPNIQLQGRQQRHSGKPSTCLCLLYPSAGFEPPHHKIGRGKLTHRRCILQETVKLVYTKRLQSIDFKTYDMACSELRKTINWQRYLGDLRRSPAANRAWMMLVTIQEGLRRVFFRGCLIRTGSRAELLLLRPLLLSSA